MFACIFAVEGGLKLFALRKSYFADGWNCFDFICVVATFFGIAIDRATDLEIGSVMSAIRIFRIARLFRLVRFAKGLNRLFTAFILSIPKLLNVAAILFFLLFLFSVLGVQLFAKVRYHDPHSIHGNFHDFYRAFMTLVRCMTGEAFNEMMHSLSKNLEYFAQIDGSTCYPTPLLEMTPSNGAYEI